MGCRATPISPQAHRLLQLTSSTTFDNNSSNSIANEVVHERVVSYSREYERNKDYREAREVSRALVLLRAEQPIVAVEDFAFVNADACIKAGLSPSELNVADMKDGRYYVAGLVPIELHRSNDPTDFREPLPFPPDELTVNEWFVVFAAISEFIPGDPTLCPFARVPDKIVDVKETTRMMKQRNAVDSLVSVLRGMTDIAPFKAARRIVDRELCKECLSRLLRKARNKRQFTLIDFDQAERPAFLPTGWVSSYWPASDDLESVREWLECTLEALLHWQESLQGAEANDIVTARMIRQAREDAWLMACHLCDQHGIKNDLQPPTDDSLSAVTRFLDESGQAIAKLTVESPADQAIEKRESDDGYVAASLLYRDRFESLTALKRWLTNLPQGKVRSRKPSPQRLEIHNADWTRYWAEDDRVKSEALDVETLQETIANIEARKLEERTKKKSGRA